MLCHGHTFNVKMILYYFGTRGQNRGDFTYRTDIQRALYKPLKRSLFDESGSAANGSYGIMIKRQEIICENEESKEKNCDAETSEEKL